MVKFEEIVPEAATKKENLNVCHRAKHTVLVKKQEPQQLNGKDVKIQTLREKVPLKMSELDRIRHLAGIKKFSGYKVWEGSNISITGNEKADLMKKHDIKPGTPEWFSLWFALPYLTNEKFGDKKWLR